MDNRGQSEALSFVFVFAIIVTTIGVVFAVGYPGLQNTQDFERVNNAERALTSLASSVDEQAQRGAPSRATEFKLSEASLSVRSDEQITVTVDGTDPVTFGSQTLVYDAGTGETLTYGNGFLSREGATGGTVLIRDPTLVTKSGDTTIVMIPLLRAEAKSVGGEADVLVRTERETPTVVERPDGGSVTISITSSRADLWFDYFDDAGLAPTKTGNTVECTFTSGTVHITTVPIDLSFS